MRLALLSLIAVLSMGAQHAHAGGFLVSKIGGDSAGAVSGSPSALFWNPAALGLLKGSTLYVDNNLVLRKGRFTRDTTHVDEEGEVYEEATLSSIANQPMIAAASDFGLEDWHFGLGVYAPFGSTAVWDDPKGPQRYEGIYGRIVSIYVTPAVVWEPVQGLHLSVFGSYVRASVESYRARDFAPLVEERAGGGLPREHPGHEGRVLIDFAGNSFSYGAGFLYTTGPWRIGLSYVSEVNLSLDGTLSVFLPNNDFYRDNVSADDIEESATFEATWPRALRWGSHYRPNGDWVLSLSAEWVQWSLYDTVEIDVAREVPGVGDLDTTQTVGYQDTINLRLGARTRMTQSLWLFYGGGFETAAIPDEFLTPNIIDTFKAGAALGVSWDVSQGINLRIGYTHIVFFETEVTESKVDPPQSGTYAQQVGVVNTNVTYSF